MLRRCQTLLGYHLGATDGEIGAARDFYFDDQNWTVRYLVADTGYWLTGRLVLISPHALKEPDDTKKLLPVYLTRKQIEDSPPITADQPVSRQYEREFYRYYGWPFSWAGPALWGPGPYPIYYAPIQERQEPSAETANEEGDPHLRSVQEITGYHLQARDGELGQVDDFIIDDKDWAIRYMVADTRRWLPGKKVLIAPAWIEGVSWDRSTLSVDLPKETIKHAPAFDEASDISRAYEAKLFNHYSREGYWAGRQENEGNGENSRGF
jgi:hypothetical protein